ncbi:hypothetical protein MMC30_002687 [Trapelia coarctata]|nr:hypothetical protein [Trapelia coarctata]
MGGEQKLGLAISGGVDSMALAFLCQSLTKLPSWKRGNHVFQYIPFIVDHKAREGSTEEALLVSKRLKELLDVEPIILPLSWPDGVQPSALSSFESDARRLRYQALGRACRLHGVQSLLVAHHADDTAETILARLSGGAGTLGLQGIRPSTEIPECWGKHGVHQSGKARVINRGGDDVLKHAENFHANKLDKQPIPIERGGVLICRPFLPFRKSELIATCQSQGVQWVEDETNQDPTKTLRNAARKLLSSDGLPRALRPQRLLALARKNEHQIEQRKNFAARLLRATHVKSFDLRSGTISIQVPIPPPSICWHNSTINSLLNRNQAHFQYEVSMALRRLIEVVSPLERIPMTTIGTATEIISGSKEAPVAFTAAGVKFVRSKEKLPCEHAYKTWEKWNMKARGSRRQVVREAFKSTPAYVWNLTRAPYRRQEPLPMIPIKSKTLNVPYHLIPNKPSFPSRSFHLWDGRFWISVLDWTGPPLCIRPLAFGELKPFTTALGLIARAHFGQMLDEAAPGDLKWTLPVIAFADDVPVKEGESRVLALPSLGVGLPEWKEKLKWNLRYRQVDLDCGRKSIRWN